MQDTQKFYQEVGQILKKTRESKGLTQKQIGEILDIDPKVYEKYEEGTKRISTKLIIKLAIYYDVSTDYLAGLTTYPYRR